MTARYEARLRRRLLRGQEGFVAAMVAVLLAALMGLTGLGVETGLWYAIKRQNQSAADEAALSGAMEVAANKSDVSAQANCTAWRNGFDGSVTSSTCPTSLTGITVNNPPTSGAHSGDNNFVEVILSQSQTPLFASINLASITIKTRAVAGPALATGCILALDPSASGAISLSNNATVSNTHCGIADDSNSSSALSLSSNAVIEGPVDVVGNWSLSNGAHLNGNPNISGGAYVSDPYSSLALPSPLPACTGQTSSLGNDMPSLSLTPGHFCSGWNFGNNDTINLAPGTYYIDNQLIIGGTTIINGTGGVTIVINGNYAVSIGNNAILNLVGPGPSSGQPFPGMALMDLSTQADVTQNLNNDGVSFNLTGAIYFRNQILNFSNNVSLAGGCAQTIARIIDLSNNVNIDDNCNGVGITPISIVGNVALVE